MIAKMNKYVLKFLVLEGIPGKSNNVSVVRMGVYPLPNHDNTEGGVKATLHSFLTTGLYRGERSTPGSGRFTPGIETHVPNL